MGKADYIFNEQVLISEETLETNPHTWKDGIYQKAMVEFFAYHIRDAVIVLDIGAQSGAFSLLAKFFPCTYWYSFEPDLDNYELLLENIKLNKITNITTCPYAISDFSGKTVLNSCISHKGLNTLGKPNRFKMDDSKPLEVEVKTIDELFSDRPVDVIKCDAEGAEYNILKGAADTISRSHPKILLEYEEANLNQFEKTREDLNSLIKEIGYHVTWTYQDNVFIEYKEQN